MDKIITYLILLYDPDSPLRREVPDWITRRKEAMIMAGYPVQKTGRFAEKVELVLENKNPDTLLMLMKLLRIFGSPDYTALIMYYHLFNATLQAQAMGTFDKPSVLIKAISDTLDKIKEQEHIVFGGQETLELKKALYKDIADDQSNVKVENIAELLSKGDDLGSFNPYGKYDVTDGGEAFGFVADE
ncbi:MAG: hypothetical protein ACTSU6_03400 [Candidatus Njordarchaeales archaeon]